MSYKMMLYWHHLKGGDGMAGTKEAQVPINDIEYGTEASRELALDLVERMRIAQSSDATWISAKESIRQLRERDLLEEKSI